MEDIFCLKNIEMERQFVVSCLERGVGKVLFDECRCYSEQCFYWDISGWIKKT